MTARPCQRMPVQGSRAMDANVVHVAQWLLLCNTSHNTVKVVTVVALELTGINFSSS